MTNFAKVGMFLRGRQTVVVMVLLGVVGAEEEQEGKIVLKCKRDSFGKVIIMRRIMIIRIFSLICGVRGRRKGKMREGGRVVRRGGGGAVEWI